MTTISVPDHTLLIPSDWVNIPLLFLVLLFVGAAALVLLHYHHSPDWLEDKANLFVSQAAALRAKHKTFAKTRKTETVTKPAAADNKKTRAAAAGAETFESDMRSTALIPFRR